MQAAAKMGQQEMQLREVFRTLRPILVGMGIQFAFAAASMLLIPDAAVKTKQEIDEDTELSTSELMLRKVAVSLIVNSARSSASTMVDVSRLLRVPGVESKVRAAAALLASTPSFYIAFKALKRKFVDKEQPTLSIRELVSPGETKAIFTAAGAGNVLNAGATGWALAENLDKIK